MVNASTPKDLIALARCLTHFQSDLTGYELDHYAGLDNSQRTQIERTLSGLASCAGLLYANSVQLEFEQVQPVIQKMQVASEELKRFLQKAQKIQQVLEMVSILASLADAIVGEDVDSIISGIDNTIRMTGID